MKNVFTSALTIYILLQSVSGCKRFDEIDKNDLKIADTVDVLKVGHHEVFEGTRVFMEIPDGYIYDPSLLRFQKDSNTFIQVLENPSLSFKDVKDPMLAKIDELQSKGLKS